MKRGLYNLEQTIYNNIRDNYRKVKFLSDVLATRYIDTIIKRESYDPDLCNIYVSYIKDTYDVSIIIDEKIYNNLKEQTMGKIIHELQM